jgi:hypothetical protein
VQCRDGLSLARKRELHEAHLEVLDSFGALPALDDEEGLQRNLTAQERKLFWQLQQRAYADTEAATYVPLRWQRADGCVRQRECAMVYDPKRRRYLFLAYILPEDSRHRHVLKVNNTLIDVDNPTMRARDCNMAGELGAREAGTEWLAN